MTSQPVPTVSVAIVSWNTRDLLRACLASLPWGSDRVRIEAIVVDNGSSDGSREMIRSEFPSAILVENARNEGFARATNQALARATGEYLFLLNSDAEVRPGCVERLVEAAETDPGIGPVGPRLLNPDGTVQESWGPFPRAVHRFLPGRFEQRYRGQVEKELSASPDRTARVEWLSGAALLFRRNVLETVGPLDERFFMWYDDLDWCQRARRAGYDRVLVSNAEVIHHGRQSGSRLGSQELATQLFDSEYTYLRLHGGRPNVCATFALRVGKALLRRVAASPPARADAAFRLAYHRTRLIRFCLAPLPPRRP